MARKATRRKVRYDGIDAVDLFCGGGGLTCGLRQMGIDVRMGVDFDGRCEYAYEHNNDFCQNRFWDAKSLLIKFIRRAKREPSSQFQFPMKEAA